MTDRDPIAELRELESAATPGPWDVESRLGSELTRVYGGNGWPVALIARWSHEADQADAAFIAAARNALPLLLDVVDLLRRLGQWDVFNAPAHAPGATADGPYWKREIDRALARLDADA